MRRVCDPFEDSSQFVNMAIKINNLRWATSHGACDEAAQYEATRWEGSTFPHKIEVALRQLMSWRASNDWPDCPVRPTRRPPALHTQSPDTVPHSQRPPPNFHFQVAHTHLESTHHPFDITLLLGNHIITSLRRECYDASYVTTRNRTAGLSHFVLSQALFLLPCGYRSTKRPRRYPFLL
jgi:hypothetical protein